MAKPKIDKSREERIDEEIIVDCYGEAERAMGWYYYLEDRLEFPFTPLEKALVSVSSQHHKELCPKLTYLSRYGLQFGSHGVSLYKSFWDTTSHSVATTRFSRL